MTASWTVRGRMAALAHPCSIRFGSTDLDSPPFPSHNTLFLTSLQLTLITSVPQYGLSALNMHFDVMTVPCSLSVPTLSSRRVSSAPIQTQYSGYSPSRGAVLMDCGRPHALGEDNTLSLSVLLDAHIHLSSSWQHRSTLNLAEPQP
jgi:hypothetical protein